MMRLFPSGIARVSIGHHISTRRAPDLRRFLPDDLSLFELSSTPSALLLEAITIIFCVVELFEPILALRLPYRSKEKVQTRRLDATGLSVDLTEL